MKCDNANGLYNTPVLTTKTAIDRGIFRFHVLGLLTIFWLLSLVFAPTAKAQTFDFGDAPASATALMPISSKKLSMVSMMVMFTLGLMVLSIG